MSKIIQILIGIALSPISLYFYWKEKSSKYTVREKLRERNRYLSWSEIEPKLRNQEGSIIIECSYTNSRFWWTPDNVLSKTELRPEPIWPKAVSHKSSPFALWCYSHYLNTDFGSAILFECFSDSDFDSFELLSKNIPLIEVPFINN
jgi:hypothetical protein